MSEILIEKDAKSGLITKWKKNAFNMESVRLEDMYESRFISNKGLILFRVAAFIFMVGVLIGKRLTLKSLKYLTVISFIFLTLYYALLIGNTIYFQYKRKTRFDFFIWHFYGCLFTTHLGITIMYWSLIRVPWIDELDAFMDFSTHAFPVTLFAVEFFLVRITVPFANFVFAIIYPLSYVLFKVLMVEAFQDEYPYGFLNFKQLKMGVAAAYVAGIVALFLFLFLILAYFHKVRDDRFRKKSKTDAKQIKLTVAVDAV